MDGEIISTKRFFQSHNITLSDFWLESCIQWYREENPSLSYTLQTLHLKVYEQWLLLDLRDVELAILPVNLAQQKKIILNGIYSLQMMHAVDISRSKFYQIQKLRNNNALVNSINEQDTQTVVNHGKRMLQLLLTDGVQEIEAIEYKMIPALNINLPPGTKIKITGPIVIRRGQMMLEEKNVHVLGGEVEELLICNAAENVLAKALNLPLNPHPNVIKEESVVVNSNVNVTTVRNVESAGNRSLQQTTLPVYSSAQSTNNSNKNNNINQNNTSTRQAIFADEEMQCFEDNLLDTNAILRNDNQENVKQSSNSRNQSSDSSIFEDMDIDAHLDAIDEQHMKNLLSAGHRTDNKSVKKQIGIGELLSNNITSGKFTIQAKFKSVVKKLTVTDNAWSLQILITDDKNEMEVGLHTDVISDLIGYDPAAIMALKKDIFHKDKNAIENLRKIIDELKNKIMHLNCKMEITFSPNQAYPTITSFK